MLGYIKPKELKLESFKDIDGDICYKFDCADECPEEYRELSDHIFATEEDARIAIENIEWQRVIKQELEELDMLRDELIAKEAPVGAKLGRMIKKLNDGKFFGDPGVVSMEELFELQERDKVLKDQITALDVKEERIQDVVASRRWGTGFAAVRNRHINYHGRVLFDKKEGYYYIDLDKETDCITKRVTGKNLEELREKISIEDGRFRTKQGVIPESGSVNSGWLILHANRSIAKLSAAETRYLLELYNYAIFGSEIDRKAAREKIFEMLGLNNSLERINDLELRLEGHKLREIAESSDKDNWDSRAFAGYIDGYTDRTGKTKGWLCDTIQYDQSNLSKCLSGKQRPSKATALRLALAMELPLVEIKGFMAAAGHPFPSGGSGGLDEKIIWLFTAKGYKPLEVLEEIMRNSEKNGAEKHTTEKNIKKTGKKDTDNMKIK